MPVAMPTFLDFCAALNASFTTQHASVLSYMQSFRSEAVVCVALRLLEFRTPVVVDFGLQAAGTPVFRQGL